jgi:hypothetical protein
MRIRIKSNGNPHKEVIVYEIRLERESCLCKNGEDGLFLTKSAKLKLFLANNSHISYAEKGVLSANLCRFKDSSENSGETEN